MPLFDFRCTVEACNALHVDILTKNTTKFYCRVCGADCKKEISAHAKTASAWEVNPKKDKE